MKEVEDNILESVLREIDLGSTNPPDIQDMPSGYLERGSMVS